MWERVKRSKTLGLCGVVLLAVAVRGGFLLARGDSYEGDPDAYRAIAIGLAETGMYGQIGPGGEATPTAFRPPLYPAVLSLLVDNGRLPAVAVATLHLGLGVATVLLTYWTARRILSAAGGIVASILVAVDPILLDASTQLMTETLAATLAAAVSWWWVRGFDSGGQPSRVGRLSFAVALGGWLGLAYLCRPTFLVWACLLAGSFALLPQVSRRRRCVGTCAVLAVVAVTVGGWTWRNVRTWGEPIWATTHGGYTLLLGNNPLFYNYLRERAWFQPWDAEPFLAAYRHRYQGDPRSEAFWERSWADEPVRFPDSPGEVADDRLAYESARATIRREPAMFAWSAAVRLGRLWSPIPHRAGGRSLAVVIASGLYYLALYAMIAVGLWRLGRRAVSPRWWPVWTLVITLSVVHSVYWSNLRMRAPAMPGLAIVAAAAATRREKN